MVQYKALYTNYLHKKNAYCSMNKKIATVICCFFIIMAQLFQTTFASHYAPHVYYAKPSKDEPYLANASLNFTAGFANQAYNAQGTAVPFLQQYGPEDFLLRFVDPSLGPDNLASAGQGYISGNYEFKQMIFALEKNIFHQLLFGIISSFQDLSVTNITPKFIDEEISLAQNTYLEKLERVIPSNINASGMNSTVLYLGYNESITTFNRIDSIDILLLAGIITPQIMKNDNQSILQYSPANNYYFGYPIIAAITIGVRDWFGFGATGQIIPYQPTQKMIPINRTSENNFLLFSQETQATVQQSPFISGTLYVDIENPASGIKGAVAYTYSKYLQSVITPIDRSQFPFAHANRSILLDGYTFGSLLFELEIDCSGPTKKLAPIISFFYSMPILGNYYQKVYFFGGECNLQINLEF